MMTEGRSALLIVDVQKDFCPGGALAVPDGNRVVAQLNHYIADAVARGWPVYVSRDWHPRVTQHFQPWGGEWPPHCVQGTEGAAFHDDLQLPSSAIVISKGQAPDKPGYSALEGVTAEGRTLLDDLHERAIERLYVAGLATDYCVKHSVLESRRAGLDVTVLTDAIAGVDLKTGDSERALEEMHLAGAHLSRHL